MKLYHGSSYHLTAGDSLSVDKSSDATIYATSNIRMAISHSLRRINMLPQEYKDTIVLYGTNVDTVLTGSLCDNIYIYEVEPNGFSRMIGSNEVWTLKSDARIIKPIQITPQMLMDAGYDVRKVKGGRLLKKIIFKLAKQKIAQGENEFNKFIDAWTYRCNTDNGVKK